MRKVIIIRYVLCALFLSFFAQALFADDMQKLTKNAEKKNDAHSWNKVADYYYNLPDTSLCLIYAEKAYSLAIKENNDVEKGIALVFSSLLHVKQENWSECIKQNEEALNFLVLSDDIDMQREALDHIASAYFYLGNYDSVFVKYSKAVDISEKNNKKDRQLANSLIGVGAAYLYMSRYDSVLKYVNRALEVAAVVKDTVVLSEGHSQLGIVNSRKGNYMTAIEHYERSLQLLENTDMIDRKAILWLNIATLYAEWRDYDKSLTAARKAAVLAQSKGDSYDIGRTFSVLGQVLVFHKRYQEAIDTLTLAQFYMKKNPNSLYYVYLGISHAYDLTNREDSCFFYMNKAENVLVEANYIIPSFFYVRKGAFLAKHELYNEAIPELLKYFELEENKNKEGTYEVYYYLAKSYERGPKDYEKAMYYYDIAYQKRDSLYKKEHEQTLNDFYAKYQTAEKEIEISRLNEEKQQILYNRALMGGGFAVVAVLLLSAWLYNNMQKQRKAKEVIVLSLRVKEKESEFSELQKESEVKQMRHYLDGLEAERSRLAKELHDNVANRLYMLEQKLSEAGTMPGDALGQMEELYNRVRNISHELVPPMFQYAGLPEILYDHVESLNGQGRCVFDINIENEELFESLDAGLSHELYRVVQECTGNVVKHSGATAAEVRLSAGEGNIVLAISDHGRGFGPRNAKGRGIGLHIVRERCRNLNGSLEIDSPGGQGCRIMLVIPYVRAVHSELQS